MIAPKIIVLSSDAANSVVVALAKYEAKNGPSGAPWVIVASMPPNVPSTSAKMSRNVVSAITARKRGTTSDLTGSMPSTCSASSSSRILRAPRSAQIAVPTTPAMTIAQTSGANSRITTSANNPPRRSSAPKSLRKPAAWIPAGPYVNASEATIIGNHATRSPKMNWSANSGPQVNGGRTARQTVLRASTVIAPTSETHSRTRGAPGTPGRGSETGESDG